MHNVWDAVGAMVVVFLVLWLAERAIVTWFDRDQDFRDVEHRERGMVALAKIHRESRRDTQ